LHFLAIICVGPIYTHGSVSVSLAERGASALASNTVREITRAPSTMAHNQTHSALKQQLDKGPRLSLAARASPQCHMVTPTPVLACIYACL